jgi:hypothetical protein
VTGQASARLQGAERLAGPRHTVRAWLAPYKRGGLAALVTIQKPPGNPSTLSPAVRAKLPTRFHELRGCGSSSEMPQYLASDPHVELAYRTGPGLVRYQLQAKAQSPRRSQPKQTLPPLPSFTRPSRRNS